MMISVIHHIHHHGSAGHGHHGHGGHDPHGHGGHDPHRRNPGHSPVTAHKLAVQHHASHRASVAQGAEAQPNGHPPNDSCGEGELRPGRPGAYPPLLGRPPVDSGSAESLVSPREDAQAAIQERRKSEVLKNGVKQWIYTRWIKDEIEREAACLELPFTVALLVCFSLLAITYVSQDKVTLVEEAIVNDITENANFAWAHHFGHKGITDVNSFADFWSWCRLGFVPLLAPKAPWPYSEELSAAVPQVTGAPAYDVGALPTRWPMPGHRQRVPARNDYLRYNRIIGGFRFRQQVAAASAPSCVFPGDENVLSQWLGKLCTGRINEYLPPDLYASETFDSPDRVEWFISDAEDHETLIRRVIDMEDGCTSARAQNRSCLCEWCAGQDPAHPWLNELTKRVEISFILYNAQYGLYAMATVNFWFSRTGHIHKQVNVRTSWAGLMVRDYNDLIIVVLSGVVWILSCMYVFRSEAKEIVDLVRAKKKPWYLTIADDYIGFWNCVDWISIGIAAIISVLFLMLNLSIGLANTELAGLARQGASTSLQAQGSAVTAQYVGEIRSFYKRVEEMAASERHFRLWLCVYPTVLMLRLFKSFDAQPRLAVVTNTFKEARDDLLHFALVFLSVYLCMSVNAVLFFGQDTLEFATLDRALHSSFRAMLGDWDWDQMKQIGLIKAFLWFFAFMLVMVLLLLNMLLAILMESYGQVKDLAKNEASMFVQIRNMIRRYRQSQRGERVRLKDIWAALLSYENDDDAAMLRSEKDVFPRFLVQTVPGIPRSQALRTLCTAQEAYDVLHEEPLEPDALQDTLQRTEERLDNMVLCSAWLSWKLQAYHQQLKGREQDREADIEADDLEELWDCQSTSSARSPHSQGHRSSHGSIDQGALSESIEAVRQVTQEQTLELADGVAAVLGEEMQVLERRQAEQQRSMQDMRQQLDSQRRLIFKLCRTCDEVGQLAVSFEHTAGTAEAGGRESISPRRALQRASAGTGVGLLPPPPSGGRKRLNEDPFFNSRFSSAVGGTRYSA